jgi:hypothetical protein
MHATARPPDQRPGMNNSIDEEPQVLLIRALAGDSAIGSFLTWKKRAAASHVNIRRLASFLSS